MNTKTPISRGTQTRDALLAAAMEIFGRAGYDAASNRAIAKAAGANQALIGYHFGSKRGLYLAVFEHIAEQMQLELLPRIGVIQRLFTDISMADPDRRERCVAAIEELLGAMIDILTRPESKTWARLVMREQQDPSEAFEILFNGFMQRMVSTLSALAALAEGIEEESEETRLRGIFLASQVLVFVMAPAVVSRHMNWSEGAAGNSEGIAGHVETIKGQLHNILQQQFNGGTYR